MHATQKASHERAPELRDQVVTKADRLVGIGRDGLSRGVLLVKAAVGKLVVGIGY